MSTTGTISSSLGPAPVTRRRRVVQRVLTALRFLLALLFAGTGLMKLGGADSMVKEFADIGVGQWFRYFVGVLEIACAVGLLIPRIVGVAAAGLTAIMVGALFTQAVVLGGTPIIEVVYLIAIAAIAYDRREQIRSLATRILR